MKLLKIIPQVACALTLGLAVPAYAQTSPTTLHAFTGMSEETDNFPYAHLVLSGSTFYGTTFGNGSNSEGTVFKVNTNGTGFTVLYTFTGISDGANPQAGLILSGSTLYGTTGSGGGSGYGTVFSVSTSGTGFKVLHTFTGGSDGGAPLAGLVLSGSTLYGTTFDGGSGNGTVFKVGTSGSGFASLWRFSGGHDGANPQADLVLSGSTLYGTTSQGGDNGNGTVFSITTGGALNTLYTFSATTFNGSEYANGDGASPVAGLVLSGGTLYGTAEEGGLYGEGTLFSITTSGAFNTLWNFTGGYDGGNPVAGLVYSGGTLYGTASEGGNSSLNGTVFSFTLSTGLFNPLHFFVGSDGSYPVAALTLSGSTLYGTTPYGGSGTNVLGTMFKVGTGGTDFATLYNFTATTFVDGEGPNAGLARSGNMLYGTTFGGGTYGYGTVYQVTIDGTLYKTLYSFTGGSDGAYPTDRLVVSGSTLYGTTAAGGAGNADDGTVFKINTNGSGFGIIHNFSAMSGSGTNSDGAQPGAGLVLSGSTLYGTAEYGGSDGVGTLFQVGTNASGFKVLHTFTGGNDGGAPSTDLILSSGTLYSTTYGGGSGFGGTVFSYNTSSKAFTTLHGFNGSDGSEPLGALVLSGSTLYGTTQSGGSNSWGTVFKVNTNKSGFATIWNFTGGSDGNDPTAGMVLSGGVLYGTTEFGGSVGAGTVFSLNLASGALTPLWAFTNGYDGGYPAGQLILSNNILYGTASLGGIFSPQGGGGTVFSLPTQ